MNNYIHRRREKIREQRQARERGRAAGDGSDVLGSGMWGIEMRGAPGKEADIPKHFSRSEKKSFQSWSLLGRQDHLYATEQEAANASAKFKQQYPHLEYRPKAL